MKNILPNGKGDSTFKRRERSADLFFFTLKIVKKRTSRRVELVCLVNDWVLLGNECNVMEG